MTVEVSSVCYFEWTVGIEERQVSKRKAKLCHMTDKIENNILKVNIKYLNMCSSSNKIKDIRRLQKWKQAYFIFIADSFIRVQFPLE